MFMTECEMLLIHLRNIFHQVIKNNSTEKTQSNVSKSVKRLTAVNMKKYSYKL